MLKFMLFTALIMLVTDLTVFILSTAMLKITLQSIEKTKPTLRKWQSISIICLSLTAVYTFIGFAIAVLT